MIFSKAELICFNSVLGGGVIFGTHFKAGRQDEEYVQATVETLAQKGFLDENRQPNKLFVAAVRMLQEYKQATRHLFLNKARLALGKRFLVALTPVGNDYDMSRMDKALFFAGLLEQAPRLKEADTAPLQTVQMPPARWNDSWKPSETVEDYYWMQQVDNRQPGRLAISYRIGGQMYLYKPVEQTLTKCGPQLVRRTMMDMLGLDSLQNTPKEANHGQHA